MRCVIRQQILTTYIGFEKFAGRLKRESFLDEMEKLFPWAALAAPI